MIKYKVEFADENGAVLCGKRREAKVSEVKKVHDCLYKFSIQKAMELMKNRYYFRLFRVYYTSISNGATGLSETMQKNREAYLRAFKILLGEGH
jgi:hypothetical protein